MLGSFLPFAQQLLALQTNPAEWSAFKVGAATYPLPAATTNQTLADADPTLGAALDYIEFALNHYMGARWTAETTALGFTDTTITASPVAYKIPYEPTEYLTEQQIRLPLLAVYRNRQTNTDRTVSLYDEIGEWSIAWVMPPLTSGQMERLYPLTRAAVAIVTHALYMLFDESFENGAAWLANAGIATLEVLGAEYGKAQVVGTSTNLVMPGVQMRLKVHEMQSEDPGAFGPIGGVDTNASLDPGGGAAVVPNVVQVTSNNH